jgi:hypothetical protein
MPRWLVISLLLMVAALAIYGFSSSSHSPASGSNTGAFNCPSPPAFREINEPLQSDVGKNFGPQQLQGATLTPLAGFSLQARVLGRENYYFDSGSEFSPTDLALGWGPMAEPGMADKLNVSQSGRWFHYSWGSKDPPLALDDIITHASNMHIVPADALVARQLKQVSKDDVITIHGWLVRLEKSNGWKWQSSLSRSDAGDGACELVYVCSIEIKH